MGMNIDIGVKFYLKAASYTLENKYYILIFQNLFLHSRIRLLFKFHNINLLIYLPLILINAQLSMLFIDLLY